MERLICTRADKNIREMCDLTHPILKKYAKRCGADFMVLDHESDCEVGDGRHHYRIMKLHDLLCDYDTIAHIDSDVVLNTTMPDIFEVVGDDIGTIFEDVGTREKQRRGIIERVQVNFGDIGWRTGYINTGIFVVSRRHRDIFTKIKGKYWEGWGFDDAHLGYQINRLGFKVKQLCYMYNHMTMHSEPWNNNADRFDSYAVHYAGQGIFDPKFKTKLENMKHDIGRIYAKV